MFELTMAAARGDQPSSFSIRSISLTFHVRRILGLGWAVKDGGAVMPQFEQMCEAEDLQVLPQALG